MYLKPEFIEQAEDALVENVDLWQDWLGGACIFKPRVFIAGLPIGADLVARIENEETHWLVAASLYPRDDVILAAMKELKQRFIKDHAWWIQGKAEELQAEAEEK